MRRACSHILALAALAAAAAGAWENPSSLATPPLKWEIPKAERFTLANGMVVYLQRDADLPLLNVSALVRVGSIYEPADKVGLAALTGMVMRTGGTAAPGRPHSGDEIDAALEYRAATVETAIGRENGSAGIACLAADADFALELLHDILVYPAFDPAKLELARNQQLEALRRQNDNPNTVGMREFAKAVYGGDSPWARTPTPATVAAVTRDDLIAFHRAYFRPNNVILTVYGDVEAAAMRSKLEKLFADWPREETTYPAVAAVDDALAPGVYLVNRKYNQSTIVIGHLGLRRHDPDEYRLAVMNQVLGGGFNSRMTSAVRSDRGLAYAAWSTVTEGTDRGLLIAFSATRAGATGQAIAVMKDVIASMQTRPATGEELAFAREAIVNRFVFNFEGRGALVNKLAELEYFGYPVDYLATYRERIGAVTAADVKAAADKHLHPDALKILVVGDAAGFEKPLGDFGPVTEVLLEP